MPAKKQTGKKSIGDLQQPMTEETKRRLWGYEVDFGFHGKRVVVYTKTEEVGKYIRQLLANAGHTEAGCFSHWVEEVK